MKQIKNSIKVKTLLNLVLFSITILFALWIFQRVFFSFYYERYQVKKIDNLVTAIIKDYSVETLEKIAFDNAICIEVHSNNNAYQFNTLNPGCVLSNRNNETINTYKKKLYNSHEKTSKIRLVNARLNTKSILYGIRMDDNNYIFLNASLESIDAATNAIQGQFIYIVLLVLTASILIALLISGIITKPIINLTKSAKKLADGDLNVQFEKAGINEIDELAETLNYAAKELKTIDELRRELMANVSHDLKTPLTMIKAYAEKVKDLSYKTKDKREKDLNIIIAETDRLNILVNDILLLSKMQSKNESIEYSEFDLSKVIIEIVNRYSIIKETLEYEFIVDIPDKCIIKADEKKINQVIYNFINNAINYTGSDNKVFITVKEDKKTYTVSIKDTGKGIKDEDINHIWDRYYKNNKNHQRQVVGTGLGLSIVKQILEAHGYKYGVKTKKGKGTEFYFTFNK